MKVGKSQIRHLLIAGAAFVAMLLPGSAWAISGGLPMRPVAGMPWTDSNQIRSCGMGCLYEKANENISLEALYILKKVEFLKSATDDQILNNLADYCLSHEPGESNGMSRAKACFDRYQRMEVLVLYKMRAALVQNSDQAAKLRGGAAATRAPEVVMNEEEQDNKKAQTPYVPTYEDLQTEYKKMRKLTSNEYQNWARNFPTEPAMEDFVKFRDIPRDADKPSGEKISIIDSGPDGKPKYDMDAYQNARATYQAKKSQMAEELKGMLAQTLPSPAAEMNDSTVAPESKNLYIQARGAVVQTTNMAILATNGGAPAAVPSEMSFSGPAVRGPATAAATAGQKYNGKESVLPVKAGPSGRDVFVTVTPGDLAGATEDAAKP